jgi:prepilin-type N-terminal cleavage/methylation domain-containing protein
VGRLSRPFRLGGMPASLSPTPCVVTLRFSRPRTGITLLEILVVLVIAGVLMAVSVAGFQRTAALAASRSTAQSLVSIYYRTHVAARTQRTATTMQVRYDAGKVWGETAAGVPVSDTLFFKRDFNATIDNPGVTRFDFNPAGIQTSPAAFTWLRVRSRGDSIDVYLAPLAHAEVY